jgi:hypothetical protein
LAAADLPSLIDRLLSQTIGRVYVWNLIDQIGVAQLDPNVFGAAWTYFVDYSSAGTSSADDVIVQLGKWPGLPGGSPTYPALGLEAVSVLTFWQTGAGVDGRSA